MMLPIFIILSNVRNLTITSVIALGGSLAILLTVGVVTHDATVHIIEQGAVMAQINRVDWHRYVISFFHNDYLCDLCFLKEPHCCHNFICFYIFLSIFFFSLFSLALLCISLRELG